MIVDGRYNIFCNYGLVQRSYLFNGKFRLWLDATNQRVSARVCLLVYIYIRMDTGGISTLSRRSVSDNEWMYILQK